MNNIININDKKKKVKAISPPTTRVRINYFNVKYLEEVHGGKTRVHFIDRTSLLINKDIIATDKAMNKAIAPRQR